MKRLLALLALLMLPALSSADEPTEVKVPKPKIDFQKQHELRFSGGAFPTMGDIASYPYWIGNTIDGTRSYNGPTYASGCYTLSYDFRFKKWFDLGVALGYYGEFGSKYSNVDNSKIGNNSSQYISVMPVVRFTWLNRPWVRMYSSLGVGMVFNTYSTYSGLKQYRFNETGWCAQFSPFGIAVGRALFGYAEVGVGIHGALIVGIGYRFNSQKAPKQ